MGNVCLFIVSGHVARLSACKLIALQTDADFAVDASSIVYPLIQFRTENLSNNYYSSRDTFHKGMIYWKVLQLHTGLMIAWHSQDIVELLAYFSASTGHIIRQE